MMALAINDDGFHSPARPVGLAYQPPANNVFLSERTSHQQPANSTFLSEQTSQTNVLAIRSNGEVMSRGRSWAGTKCSAGFTFPHGRNGSLV
jgi:hypothetical protein